MSAAEIPPPPWAPAPAPRAARRAPRPPLDRDAVVAAAMRVLDRDGASGLTMRGVAHELGVAAASLYTHVANKEDLIQLVLDRILGELPTGYPGDTWQEQLRNFMRAARQLLKSHRGAAELTLGRIPLGPSSLAHMETMLTVLRDARLPERAVAFAGDLIGLYVGAYAYDESVAASSRTNQPGSPEAAAQLRQWFAALPADRFPTMVAMATALARGDAEERFEWGTDVIIRGLASFIDRRRR